MKFRFTPTRLANRLLVWRQEVPFSRGIAVLLIIQLAGLGLAYLAQIFFARWLGAEQYGIYTFLLALTTILAVLPALGLPEAVLRFVPQYVARAEWEFFRGLIWRSWQLVVGLGILVAGAAWLVWEAFAVPGQTFAAAFAVGMLLVPLIALQNLQLGLARGIQQLTRAFAPMMLLRPLLLLGAAAFFLQFSGALRGAELIAIAVAVYFVILLVQVVLFRAAVPARVRSAPARYATRDWLAVAFPLMLTSLFGMAMLQASLLVLGVLGGPTQVGIYSATLKTTSLLAFVLGAANAVSAPLMASFYAQGNHAGLEQLTLTITRVAFGACFIGAVGLIIFAVPILSLFGPEFAVAQTAIFILALGQLANTAMGPVAVLLNMTGQQNATMRVMGWSAVLNVGLCIVGISGWGLNGAALADAITMIVWNVWLARIVIQRLGIHPTIFAAFARSKQEQHAE